MSRLLPSLSIIIVSWNTRDLLEACLRSVVARTLYTTYEMIVVDNGSTDGSVKMVRRCFPQAYLITNDTNKGFSYAVNQGIHQSVGQFIGLLNSDAVVLDGAFDKLVAFLEANVDAAAVGPKLLNPDGSLQLSCFAFPTLRGELFRAIGLHRLLPASPLFNERDLGEYDWDTSRSVDWVTGACLVVRREVIETVGLLDSEYFMYAEELDWFYRMKQQGLPVFFHPKAAVVHHIGQSFRSDDRRFAQGFEGLFRFLEKHHGRTYARAVRLVWIGGALGRIGILTARLGLRRASAEYSTSRYWNVVRVGLKGLL